MLLHNDEPSANTALQEKLSNDFTDAERYKFSDLVWFVRGDDLSPSDLLLKLDVGREAPAALISMNGTFEGVTWTDLWDWINAAASERPR
ncbi:MAG: hypothetical protein F4X76_01305 [Chloroflexi bacterium]|nr:hypothetical protein [Chloroflexota bacterium]